MTSSSIRSPDRTRPVRSQNSSKGDGLGSRPPPTTSKDLAADSVPPREHHKQSEALPGGVPFPLGHLRFEPLQEGINQGSKSPQIVRREVIFFSSNEDSHCLTRLARALRLVSKVAGMIYFPLYVLPS